MKNLFVVLGKLLGFYFLYLAIALVPGIMLLHALNSGRAGFAAEYGVYGTAKAGAAFVVAVVLALIFIFRAEGVARFLKVPDGGINFENVTQQGLLETGLTIAGVVILFVAIPNLVEVIGKSFTQPLPMGFKYSVPSIVAKGLQVVMGFYLVGGYRGLARKLLGGSETA